MTNSNGLFVAEIASALGEIGGFSEKAGYYRTDLPYVSLYDSKESFDNAMRTGHWQPWERIITVVLKPIINPVPMYAKKIVAFLPKTGTPIGFDLEKGDWVEPYGKGVQADWEFIGKGYIKDEHDYSGTLTLRCPGKHNGIQVYNYPVGQRSELMMPYEAPETNYASSWEWNSACALKPIMGSMISSYTDESGPNRGFIYRIRTKLDADGNVVEACYGKIHGPVDFSPRINGKWAVKMVYYLNPDKTRNLEFAPNRNLFPKEDVSEP
jgi:hypothetical protein